MGLKNLYIKMSDSYYKKKYEKEKKEKQRNMIEHLSDTDETEYEDFLKELFEERLSRELDFSNPVTYSEKIQWLKLYDDAEEKSKLVDKYEVRKYIANAIGNEHLIPLIKINGKDHFYSADEIDFSKLPNQFVIKCNHGSGYNIIVDDKSKLTKKDIAMMKKKISLWMNEQFAYKNGLEIAYKKVKPCILIEKFMAIDGDLPDYKFFCFDGKAAYLYYMQNYTMHHELGELGFLDMDFNIVASRTDYAALKYPPKRPENFDEMIVLAEKLAQGFPHVRVDFYNIDGHIYFGELTFYNSSGLFEFNPNEFDTTLGNLIPIDQSKRENNYRFRKQ